MNYLAWLIGISVAFALLERLLPARASQPSLRPQLGNDVFYLLLHGYFYGLLVGGLTAAGALATRDGMASIGVLPAEGFLQGLHVVVQFLILFVLSDFMQWCVHRVLHGVPALWRVHQVHHSIHQMDWAGNFRFHWIEVVLYRSVLYVPLVWMGASPGVTFTVAVCGTAWGHFNHANVKLDIGPMAYVFNSPKMHLWHHDASEEGGVAKNFGIVLSCWDWLFGTAFWPRDREPERLGYPEDDSMPANLALQLVYPLFSKGSADPTNDPS
ncbi:MAG: sterol desaturase/sphingolipid hydroxylase (fatty acid hydroxylase superfamily) [Planctomycetota bacterium]|jgi:sterol desaturase/sphingolipid hydroxylase (fatty acid hydroxylase superfamily)